MKHYHELVTLINPIKLCKSTNLNGKNLTSKTSLTLKFSCYWCNHRLIATITAVNH